jgi:hypothetical protein
MPVDWVLWKEKIGEGGTGTTQGKWKAAHPLRVMVYVKVALETRELVII